MSIGPSPSPSPPPEPAPSPAPSPGISPGPSPAVGVSPAPGGVSGLSPLPLPGAGEAETAALDEAASLLDTVIAGASNLLLDARQDSAPAPDMTGVPGYWTDDPATAAGRAQSPYLAGPGTGSASDTPRIETVSNTQGSLPSDTLGDSKALVVRQTTVDLYPGPSWDNRLLDGVPMMHTEATVNGERCDIYTNDERYSGLLLIVPSDRAVGTLTVPGLGGAPASAGSPAATSPPPAATPPATPLAATPPAAAPPMPAPEQPGWGMGDLLATIAGLFSPASVSPYLQPRMPAGLPPGLQVMGQLNASGAQAGLRVNGLATKAGVVGIGGATTIGFGGATLAPAATETLTDLSIKTAVNFPRATDFAMSTVDALAGNSVPRVAIAGGTAAGARLLSDAAHDAPVLAPEAQSVAATASGPGLSTEAAPLLQARDEAAETARRIVQQEMDEGITTAARAPARFGTWLDALAKANIRQAVRDERLPKTFVTSPTVTISSGYKREWVRAPDVWDTSTGRAWDFMPANQASFFAHETRYLGDTARAAGDPQGTVITEILPLFHFGFF